MLRIFGVCYEPTSNFALGYTCFWLVMKSVYLGLKWYVQIVLEDDTHTFVPITSVFGP